MLQARKKNRVVRISEEKLAEYKKLGYTVTDMAGNVVYEPENAEKRLKVLEAENAELRAKLDEAAQYAEADDEKIVALETENAELKAEIETLKAASTTSGRKKTTKASAAE